MYNIHKTPVLFNSTGWSIKHMKLSPNCASSNTVG